MLRGYRNPARVKVGSLVIARFVPMPRHPRRKMFLSLSNGAHVAVRARIARPALALPVFARRTVLLGQATFVRFPQALEITFDCPTRSPLAEV